jgi:hypothetical protein
MEDDVNDPNFLTQHRKRLANACEQRGEPDFRPLNISPWLAMSLMQKAIRRGEQEIALRAAATLLRDSPDRLWRRCGVTAFEDIGVADLEVVAEVTAALAGKTYRAQLGGEWRVASTIIKRMARATNAGPQMICSRQQKVTRHWSQHVGSCGSCPRRNCSTPPSEPVPFPNARSHSDDLVRTVLRGIRRVHARPQSRVAPLVVEELLAICERLGDSLRDIRDRALLLVGFAGAFRRSELVAVDVEDIEKAAAGVVINIRRSKTDQECHGRKVAIQYGHSALCPVQALDRWLSVSGIASGEIFRPVSRGGTAIARRLSTEAVASIIKRHVELLGRDPSRYSGHSLRAGFASSAAKAGMPTWRIKAQTGHRSDTMLALYIREAEAVGLMPKPDHPASGG